MKKTKQMVTTVIGMMKRNLANKVNNNRVYADDLPFATWSFVQKNFPRQAIAFVEREGNGYDVCLNDDTELTFNEDGEWMSVQCTHESVPEMLLPKNVAETARQAYVNTEITRINRTAYGFLIELSNSIDIKFDMQEN